MDKDTHGFLPAEVEQLANAVGEFICYWGFKKIHGRIWTHVYLSKTPLDAGQLMKRLRVSKALISLTLHDLLKFDVIRGGPKSERGTQTYLPNDSILEIILNVIEKRERKMLQVTRNACDRLAQVSANTLTERSLDPARIAGIKRMVDDSDRTLGDLISLCRSGQLFS